MVPVRGFGHPYSARFWKGCLKISILFSILEIFLFNSELGALFLTVSSLSSNIWKQNNHFRYSHSTSPFALYEALRGSSTPSS